MSALGEVMGSNSIQFVAMNMGDFDEVLALWQRTEGVGLNESDTRENIVSYLQRNPAMSFVARDPDGKLIGAVLCGHEGRRGYLHHLAVDAAHRRQGIGRALVERCLSVLHKDGITRCNIFVFADNAEGRVFWERMGWSFREDVRLMQKQVVETATGIE